MIKKHFVTFLSPGTFVHENTTKPISSWDAAKAKKMAKGISERYAATPFGFYFTTRSRKSKDLDSQVTAESGIYYLGGKVETLAQVKKRATKDDHILILNMEVNHWNKIITNTNSWKITQPLRKNDIVVSWP